MFNKRSKSKSNLTSNESSEMGWSRSSLNSVASDGIVENREVTPNDVYPIHNRVAGFTAYYLGAVSQFMMQASNRKTSEAQLVEKIEQSQLDGRLLLKPTASDIVRLRLDRHGFQVAREDSDDIEFRIPLHILAQLVMYDDGFNKFNLAVKVINGKDLFSCHVFQCPNEDTGNSICETLQRVFKAIMTENTDNSI